MLSYWNDRERKQVAIPIHKLAAYGFFGEAVFEAGVLVRHLNDEPIDNRRDNLALGSHHDNAMDIPADERSARVRRGVLKRGSLRPANARFSDDDIRDIRKLRRVGKTYDEIGAVYNAHIALIGRIIRGESYTHVQD